MHKNNIRFRFSNKFKKSIIVCLIFLLILLVNTNIFNNFISIEERSNNIEDFYHNDQILLNANGEPVLFEGIESSLIINDSGNLYDFSQEISVLNQEETNISYYLDDIHEWKASKIQTSVKNVYDTREWVQNNDFYELDIPYRNYTSYQNIDPGGFPPHNYSDDLENDPSNPSNIHSTIHKNGASAMRLHFSTIEIERDWDLLYIYDANNILQFMFTGKTTDLYTPWINSDTLKITINSDGTIEWYGYDIDYFEYYNASTNYFDYNSSWGYDNEGLAGNFGPGNISSNTAMYVSLIGNPYRTTYGDFGASYYDNEFVEIYQNLTIPRGSVIDAYIKFDYYADYAMDSNENFIYCEINNKRIFSKGLGDIVDAGRDIWHSSGSINVDLWSNTSAIFNNIQENYNFNISVGIMSGASVSYSGFDDRFQQFFWFDNISLTLTTLCNSTQSDINLTLNGKNLLNDNNQWGNSYQNFTGLWETNPIILTVQTYSPSLVFDLDTTIYGYHETTSRVGQTTQEGVSYQILENGSIYWEFTHNFYMPSQYSDFEFEISKPVNWDFSEVLDPTFQPRTFEGGNEGEAYLKINKTNANFPGWWTFRATSPNYLNISNSKTSNNGQWGVTKFSTGDSIRIKSQVNYSEEVPPNVDLTLVDLNIYYPNGTLCYQESIAPFSNGTVIFSSITFTPQDFIGGRYNYTIFWSNGTALGGVKSSFTLIHNNAMTLIKPDDAVSDLTTEAFIGDIIPLRIQLKDIENNKAITGAIINYNWTTGLETITEAALGVYETILDTSDFGSNGFYEIFINSSIIGFRKYNMTLKINLLEETNLLRLDSEYYIELHDNSTVKYSYTNSIGNGIIGATINVNIDNGYYSITDHLDGNYTIEFDTSYINDLGVYQIEINFTSPAFEIQDAIFQFEIIEQSVDISLYINSQKIQENSLFEAMFKENIDISIRILAQIDNEYLTGGNTTWNSNNFYKKISEAGNAWFNDTIPISSSNFTTGLNYIYIRFEQENYQIKNFGFQLFISEQAVNITTFINGKEIAEYSIEELTFKETINVSARVFAIGEKVFLSGANITFISDNYQKDLTETTFPWYNTSIEISGAYFNPGINYVYLKFELGNYTTEIFSFQFLIKAQKLNLTVLINSDQIIENSLLELSFNDEFSISAQSYALSEKIYLENGLMTFVANSYEKNFTGYANYWYNTSISCAPNIFSLGVNYVYLRFQKENYSTTVFSFQILVNQIELQVIPIGFQDSIEVEMGGTLIVQIDLQDPITYISIEHAFVRYSWEYGIGTLNETTPGTYQMIIELPETLQGNFRFNLIITPEDSIYKTLQHSFIVVIEVPNIESPGFPNYLLWIIIGVLMIVASLFGVLSLRSYVFLPRKRRKEAELLSKTQRFKDLKNIQAIVVIHRLSGIPIYSRSYSILEKHKKELFSGFIQAITMIGQEFTEEEVVETEVSEADKSYGVEKMIELDFKQFYCLIADIEDIRVVFILKEKSSERLKSQVSHLILALNLKLSEELEDWDGSLDNFEIVVPEILNEYFELYYKESFRLSEDVNLIAMKKEKRLSKMEMRVINVIQSMSVDNKIADLNSIVDVVSEENKDLVIEAIETLLNQKLIIPSSN